MVDSQQLYSSKTSMIESFVIRRICDPILDRLPATLNPNSVTVSNHFLYWACLFFAGAAPYLNAEEALAARVIAGSLVFISMLLDCLDGMHARRTGQTSHVGEVLDHWLDGLNTPLNAAAMALTLQLDPWTSAVVMVSMGMVYIAQLSVWHQTGHFLCPPTSGVDAQVLLSLSFIVAGVYYYVYPPILYPAMAQWFGLAFGWGAVLTAFKQLWWFNVRGPSATMYTIRANLVVATVAILYPLGFIDGVGAYVLMAIASFRVSGLYVLYTILGRSYGGLDRALMLWPPVICVVHFLLGPRDIEAYRLRESLSYLAAAHLGGLSLMNLVSHFGELRFLDKSSQSNRA
jgi:phosphatidylglycerophosphate synthase